MPRIEPLREDAGGEASSQKPGLNKPDSQVREEIDDEKSSESQEFNERGVAGKSTETQTKELPEAQEEESDIEFTRWDMSIGVVGILSYLVDLGTDFAVAVDYIKSGHIQFAGATFAIICFYGLVGSIMTGFAWRIEKADNPYFQKTNDENIAAEAKTHKLNSCFRFLSVILLLAPVARTIEYLKVGRALMKPKDPERAEEEQKKKTLELLLVFRRDSASGLRMLEGIFEALLQLHVQLYFWFSVDLSWDISSGALRGLSTAASWISVSWSLTSWYAAKRKLETKESINKRQKAVQFVYRFCEMGGRTIATAVFASRFGVAWTLIPMAVYFARGLVMSMTVEEDEDRERKPLMAIFMFFFSYIHKSKGRDGYIIASELVNIAVVYTLINVWYHLPVPDVVEWRFPAHNAAYALCMIFGGIPALMGFVPSFDC